jgi:hypothetical protein
MLHCSARPQPLTLLGAVSLAAARFVLELLRRCVKQCRWARDAANTQDDTVGAASPISCKSRACQNHLWTLLGGAHI